jgi:hypothetical protein
MSITLTGEAVSQMEADLHAATTRVNSLERSNALLDMENGLLRRSEAKARFERDEALTQCAEMRTIMEQVSSGLISGLSRMGFTKRQRQERELGVGGPDSPFRSSEGDQYVGKPAPQADHAAGLAERLMVPMEEGRPNRVDQSLADRDSRLPKLTPVNMDEVRDREALAQINDRLASRAAR